MLTSHPRKAILAGGVKGVCGIEDGVSGSRGILMKRLYVCGSFKFIREMEGLERELKEEGIQFEMPKETDAGGLLGCLRKVDDADIIYVVNPQGYFGRSVSVDIGYAYAKGKPIYVMHPLDDPAIMSLISAVLSPQALVELLKDSSLAKKNRDSHLETRL
jgi:hypothetical protein